ncbi:DUF4153 domain-containing protein [Chryseobacterium potabilaquae]|uniref:DUF4153 domain-containing protein n=1 Tax=Chryseobacterium potabilaquae TaxID=2675057 RepID=A0A6N4X3Z5_9FLAO|nr:DUF4153 domain-containing protein [Chryseobacterium potabilaquae]CAA7195580.1 hypothetical protein CHRY9293_01767 [Chryseobacterium potabilaquae]
MKKKIQETLSRTTEVVSIYPMVLLMALLASIGTIFMFENNHDREQFFPYSKFTICCCLGISLMFALKMLSQRIGKSILLQVVGIIFLIGFYFIFPKKEKDFTEIYGYIIAVTILLAHLSVSFFPFLDKNKELSFWQYNKNLFVNIFLTAIFTGVLTIGVELAILAIDKLFDFKFHDNLYTNTFYILSIFGSCFIFLLFDEKGLSTLEKEGNYPNILKFFTQFILIPLLLIYVVILYFYSIKIVINWELPRGWVSYLVLAYSIIGILALLLVHPLKEENAKSWVKIFSKAFYYTIIPLIVLLFVAIFTRILEYGYTEPRYFILILAIWLLSILSYFILNKKSNIKFIPISLFVFGIFSLVFPYLNAFSVTKRSQKSELQKILNENKLVKEGKINFQKNITDAVANEIANKFEFLAQRKQQDFLSNLLEKEDQNSLAKNIASGNFWNIQYDIQNKFIHKSDTQKASQYERLIINSEKQALEIETYRYFIEFPRYDLEAKSINTNDQFKIIDDLSGHLSLKVILNSTKEVDLGPRIEQLLKKYEGKTGTITVPEISMESDLGNYHIKLIFKNIIKEKNPYDKNANIYYDNVYLLIK